MEDTSKTNKEPEQQENESNFGNLSQQESLNSLKDALFKHKINKSEQVKDNYKFWDTQPVPKIKSDDTDETGPLDSNNDIESERKDPLKLPASYTWRDVDINNEEDLSKLYEFLRDNYVEDDDHMFRFDYSKDFLKWHLTSPGYFKEWNVSVIKETKTGEKQMVGFISAIPVHIYIHKKGIKMVEINFLCVHSKFRNSRLAPVLIKEITRRVHLKNIWQAVYTAGVLLPKPISKCTYYHRNLNIQKLLDVKFTYLSPHMNLARAKGIYKLAKEPSINGIRRLEKEDVPAVCQLLNNYLSKFSVHAVYSEEEVGHWFVPRSKVVYAYVVEDYEKREISENGEKRVITDMLSFYSLPSSVLNHEVHKTLFAAYSFFNVATSVTYKELMRNALILAKMEGFDVYNALNIMENSTIFSDLLFGQGDGSLKYYFYNYKCPSTEPSDLSLVLM